jgi:hypothetical protein
METRAVKERKNTAGQERPHLGVDGLMDEWINGLMD